MVGLFKIYQLIASECDLIQIDGSAHGACWDGGINPALSRPQEPMTHSVIEKLTK